MSPVWGRLLGFLFAPRNRQAQSAMARPLWPAGHLPHKGGENLAALARSPFNMK